MGNQALNRAKAHNNPWKGNEMKHLKITTAIIAALGVSACSGGGSTKLADVPTPEAPATYHEKMQDMRAIGTAFNSDEEFTSSADDFVPPVEGSADYTGMMYLDDPHRDGRRMVGDFEMGVNFETADVAGVADNFSNDIDEVWSGNLELDGNYNSGIAVTGKLTSEHDVDTVIEAGVGGHTNFAAHDNIVDGVATPEYIEGWLSGTSTTDENVTILDENNTGYIGELVD